MRSKVEKIDNVVLKDYIFNEFVWRWSSVRFRAFIQKKRLKNVKIKFFDSSEKSAPNSRKNTFPMGEGIRETTAISISRWSSIFSGSFISGTAKAIAYAVPRSSRGTRAKHGVLGNPQGFPSTPFHFLFQKSLFSSRSFQTRIFHSSFLNQCGVYEQIAILALSIGL